MAMRRMIVLVLAMLLCMGILPAQAAGAELTYDRAVEMALLMRDMASGDYLTINGVPESLQRRAREWAAGISDQPRLVARMDLANSGIITETRGLFSAEHPMVAYEAESNAMSEIISYSFLYAAYESIVAESMYEEIIEINSLLNCSMLYAEEAEPGTAMYIVLYDDAQPILVLATAENGAVSLNGWFVPSQQLAKSANYGQVVLWFMRNGIPMTGKEVLPE